MSRRSANEAAFEIVIRDNERDLLRYFQRRIVNGADSAEAFGELLLVAWKLHAKMPKDATQARMWCFGLAHNVLRNSRRTLARRSSAVQRLADELGVTSAEPVAGADAEVREAISTLTDEDAELVRLVYWDGLRSHEAAAVLRINPSTARSRLAKARARLRVALEPDRLAARSPAPR